MLDLRLLEDGGELGGALGSDVVACHAASEGPEGNGERVGVSTGADAKATLVVVANRERDGASRVW